jgi:hypothetical protein
MSSISPRYIAKPGHPSISTCPNDDCPVPLSHRYSKRSAPEIGTGLSLDLVWRWKWRLPATNVRFSPRGPVDRYRVDPQVSRHTPSLHSNIASDLGIIASYPIVNAESTLVLYADLRCTTGNITSSPHRIIADVVLSLARRHLSFLIPSDLLSIRSCSITYCLGGQ